MLAWDDAYATGFSEIDDQHKKLFQVINRLGECIGKGYHSYRDRYEKSEDREALVKDIHEECERWLVEHICKIDIHLKDCVSKNG